MDKLWVVRSNNGEYIEQFLTENVVGLNWLPDENLKGKDLQSIKSALLKHYPDKAKSIPVWAGIINSFINKIAIGDYVLTYDPSSRIYYIGKIAGDYLFNSKINDCPHTRKVRWDKQEISRDSLSMILKILLVQL